jgi:hypothetical protein
METLDVKPAKHFLMTFFIDAIARIKTGELVNR